MSSDITLRLEKGTDLSYEEGDENFTHIRRLYRFTEDSVTSGGSGNNYTITSVNTSQDTFEPNMFFGFIASFSNSSNNPTMAIDSLDAKTIKRGGGQTIASGEIQENSFYIIRYNNADDSYWILESPDVKDLLTSLESTDSEVSDIRTTQGVAPGSTDLGSFSGSTISNGSTVKQALQSLETLSETNENDISSNSSAIANLQALNISASASNNGSITIPYSSGNAILIQWGSVSVGPDTTTNVSYPTEYTDVFQVLCCQGSLFDPTEDAGAGVFNINNSFFGIQNGADDTQTLNWMSVGRLSI